MYTISNGDSSFEEHNEHMRRFRQMHPPDLKAKVSRQKPIDTLWLLFFNDITGETVESGSPASTANWSVLFPVHRVAAYRLSPN